jgi:hypothetical protein
LARHEIIEVTCDMCHAVLDPTSAKPERSFAIEGQTYRIDLCVMHANELEAVLAPFVASARTGSAARGRGRATSRRRVPRSGRRSTGPSEIRTWARANGFPNVSDRGRVPREILSAFQAAKAGSAAPTGGRGRAGGGRKAAAPRKRAGAKKAGGTRKAAAASAG